MKKGLWSYPCGALRGDSLIPGDKSMSHRALILGSCAYGETLISGLLESGDVLATVEAMRCLGADIVRLGDGDWSVRGVGVGGFCSPDGVIDFGNSGTAARLTIGAVSTTDLHMRATGDISLRSRPMDRLRIPLERMGAVFSTESDMDTPDSDSRVTRLPFVISGAADPIPISYILPVASAQIKSALLLAFLNTLGRSTVIETCPTRDHTERMLPLFGCDVDVGRYEDEGVSGRCLTITGPVYLRGTTIAVPGDPSSAAFMILAALITEGADVTVRNMMLNATRDGFFRTIVEMGADMEILARRFVGGEESVDVRIRSSSLRGVCPPVSRVARMIDEYPLLFVAASYAAGESVFSGIGELRVKESDRLAAMARGLERCGVRVAVGSDFMRIEGCGGRPRGGVCIETFMDHRIAMAFLVMGMGALEAIGIDDSSMISTSFPEFVDNMVALGGDIREVEA